MPGDPQVARVTRVRVSPGPSSDDDSACPLNLTGAPGDLGLQPLRDVRAFDTDPRTRGIGQGEDFGIAGNKPKAMRILSKVAPRPGLATATRAPNLTDSADLDVNEVEGSQRVWKCSSRRRESFDPEDPAPAKLDRLPVRRIKSTTPALTGTGGSDVGSFDLDDPALDAVDRLLITIIRSTTPALTDAGGSDAGSFDPEDPTLGGPGGLPIGRIKSATPALTDAGGSDEGSFDLDDPALDAVDRLLITIIRSTTPVSTDAVGSDASERDEAQEAGPHFSPLPARFGEREGFKFDDLDPFLASIPPVVIFNTEGRKLQERLRREHWKDILDELATRDFEAAAADSGL